MTTISFYWDANNRPRCVIDDEEMPRGTVDVYYDRHGKARMYSEGDFIDRMIRMGDWGQEMGKWGMEVANRAMEEVARANEAAQTQTGKIVPLGDATNRAKQMTSKPKVGTKRKAPSPSPELDDSEVSIDGHTIDQTCNQVRGKIRRLLESGTMTKKAFCEALGVSPNSLNGFLTHSGSMDGAGSDTYGLAWSYFKKRELAGVKIPAKKKATKTAASDSPAAAPASLWSVRLPGEEYDSVPVMDSCDEIRKKINAYLVLPGVTQAQFARDLAAQLQTREQKMQAKQVTDFRGKKGPMAGNTSVVYYTAYVFFEKMRVAEGRAKSAHRVEMEGRWPEGVQRDRVAGRCWVPSGKVPTMDRYGGISLVDGPVRRRR